MTRAYFSYLFGLRSQFPKPFIYRAPQSIGISWAIKAIGASFVIKFGLLSSVRTEERKELSNSVRTEEKEMATHSSILV